MKKIIGFFGVMCLGLSISQAQDFEVYRINDLEMNTKYKSFTMLKDPEKEEAKAKVVKTTYQVSPNEQMTVYSVEKWADRFPDQDSVIQNVVNYEFVMDGMKKREENPDFMIQYHIYDDDYQKDDAFIRSLETYHYKYPLKADLLSNLSDGTLVMSVIDVKTGESVWEGFAYNAYDREKNPEKNSRHLAQATKALVDKFIIDMRES